ncbi:iron chelate uptake ABC transporter family permease subunit, partial [Mangrovicoccus algicola]
VPRLARPGRALASLGALLVLGLVALAVIGRGPQGWTLLDAQSAATFLPGRLPRLAGAAAAGGLLALAGTLLQRLTANPLASPEVLGVSGGATLGYAGVLFLAGAPTAIGLALGATAGGALALSVLAAVAMAGLMGQGRVLLAGIAVSAFALSVLSVLMSSGTPQAFAVLAWMSGSAAGLTAPGAVALCALLAVLTAAALAMARWLEILPLGASVARGLGLPLRAAWIGVILLAGLATGAATVLSGPVSFVGLMAPHLARGLGFATMRAHLAGAVLTGALLMLAADFGARMASFPYDLPLGLFASLLGTPWLIWLMLRRPR